MRLHDDTIMKYVLRMDLILGIDEILYDCLFILWAKEIKIILTDNGISLCRLQFYFSCVFRNYLKNMVLKFMSLSRLGLD